MLLFNRVFVGYWGYDSHRYTERTPSSVRIYVHGLEIVISFKGVR